MKAVREARSAEAKVVATNRKAFHDFFIESRLEVGLALSGSEVKSLRAGKANLKDSFIQFRADEAYLVGAHISAYDPASWTGHTPERERKILMHRRELDRWASEVARSGVTCIPLTLYFKGARVKAEIALVKGKKLHDKRDTLREKDLRREADRAMRERKR
ncbi:MAG: SsrA-binding protein SmpB [Thermoanaerobaculia bacterium]